MSNLKERLLKEIQDLPEEKLPKLFRLIHLLTTEFLKEERKGTLRRGSLRGIWKGSQVDDALFIEAKRSLFPYEYK